MTTPVQAKASSKLNDQKKSTITSGKIFPDGSVIEMVAGPSELKPRLVLWNAKKATIAARIEFGGCTYEAPEVAPGVCHATRLPKGCTEYGSTRQLFTEIADLFKRYLQCPERESKLLACFCLSTWLADRLPTAPTLAISAPDQELGVDTLRLLNCVCRHPLMLAEVTPSSFRSLPTHLSLTLLLDQQELRPNMQRLLRASKFRGLHLAGNRGSVVDPYGPKAIFCGNDAAVDTLGGGVIQISVTPSQLQSSALDEQVQEEIANRFQPRLLMYRLKNSRRVLESRVDGSEFTFTTRQIARTLAMCFPEDSEMARDTVQLLRPQDEEVRGQQSRDVKCAIIEILWAMIHARKQREVQVDELAKNVNALLQSRGEIVEHRAEEIGWKLKSLNIKRHSDRSGRQVLLERETSQSVHRLAQAYDLPYSQRANAGCLDCNQAKTTLSK